MRPELAFGLLGLFAAVAMAWFGGPAGWLFGALYGALSVELLWSALRDYARRR